jgi:hypothetical protein
MAGLRRNDHMGAGHQLVVLLVVVAFSCGLVAAGGLIKSATPTGTFVNVMEFLVKGL